MMGFIRALTPLGRGVIGGLLLVAILALLFAVQSCSTARTAKTQARLNENQTEAATASGSDAVNTVGQQGGREDAIDAITKDNANAIRSTEGAGAPVSDALDAVARERLCQRAVYRVRPECLQYPAAD